MGDRSATRVIRDVLERILSREQASAVLFEALDAEGGEIPRSGNQLMQLVRGSLASVLARQVGDERAATVVASVENELKDPLDEETTDTDAGKTTLMEIDDARPPSEPSNAPLALDDDLDAVVTVIEDFDTTRPIPISAPVVPVVVLASGQIFADRLVIALGSKVVAPTPITNVESLLRLRGQQPPAIIIVDAGDYPRIEPVDLANALGNFPETTTKVLWCARLPYGRRCAEAFERADLGAVVLLDPSEGLDPVLDLVRSRRPQEST